MKTTITLLAFLLSIGAMAQKEKDVDAMFYDSVDKEELQDEPISELEEAGKGIKAAGGFFTVGTLLMTGGGAVALVAEMPEVGIAAGGAGVLCYLIGGIQLISAGQILKDIGKKQRRREKLKLKPGQ